MGNKSIAAKIYFSAYNLVQFVGWASVICLTLDSVGRNRSGFEAYNDVGWLVKRLQILATMELLHALVGLVGGSFFSSFVQLWGRNMVLFAVIDNEPNAQKLVVPLFLVWATIEVIRYPYYQMSAVFDRAPDWLTRLRYTAFIPLYPLGILAEIRCLWVAVAFIDKAGTWGGTFAVPVAFLSGSFRFSFSFARFIKVLTPLYLILFPKQYVYMFSLRSKKVATLPRSTVPIARTVAGFLIGIVVAVATIELLSKYVTETADTTKDGASPYKAAASVQVYLPVLATWALGAFLGGAASGGVGKAETAPLEVSLVLIVSIAVNLMGIPSPLWVWLAGIGSVVPMALAGYRSTAGLPTSRSNS